MIHISSVHDIHKPDSIDGTDLEKTPNDEYIISRKGRIIREVIQLSEYSTGSQYIYDGGYILEYGIPMTIESESADGNEDTLTLYGIVSHLHSKI